MCASEKNVGVLVDGAVLGSVSRSGKPWFVEEPVFVDGEEISTSKERGPNEFN